MPFLEILVNRLPGLSDKLVRIGIRSLVSEQNRRGKKISIALTIRSLDSRLRYWWKRYGSSIDFTTRSTIAVVIRSADSSAHLQRNGGRSPPYNYYPFG